MKKHLPSKNPKIALCGLDVKPGVELPDDAEACRRCATQAEGTWTDGMARPLPNVVAGRHHVYLPNA